MTKRMGIWMAVTMSSMFLCGWIAAAFDSHESWWGGGEELFGVLAGLSFLLLVGGTAGVLVIGLILDAYVRRTGTPVVGAVVHARPAGYTNNVPNWELELALSDGRRGRMQLTRFGSFSPGERLQLIAGRGDPARTVLPPSAMRRPSF